ncbi:FAD-binding domain-containing protein [Aspergillus cavernicola]|uniref:FAD-binding domain-containing protein n=1 Tax=Aspergillus cavernicola TaxID=176166 RepID=A0ABR4ICT6_9EURO
MAGITRTSIVSLLSDQSWSANTLLSKPGASEFTEATARWNSYQAPTYAAALSVGSEEDLTTAVTLATAHKIPFLATGGRHGYGSTLGKLQDGLALDLSPLNNMTIDASAGTLTVGPGVILSDIIEPVFKAGYQIQTGTCSCVGMIGITLGAGIGRLVGTNGLMIDALLSARVVTATGKVLEVSSTSNPDLFWAIRGAGQNFGILTSATYQLHPVTSTYTSVDLIFPADLHVTFFNALASFNISAKWAIAAQIFFNTDTGEPAIMASCVYHGPQDEALALLAPILDLGPVYRTVIEVPWNRLNAEAAFGSDTETCIRGSIHDIYGVTLRKRTAETWISVFGMLSKFYESNPDARGSVVLFEVWANHAAVAVPDDETAYPWRDAEVYMIIQGTWPPGNNSAQDAFTATAREVRATLASTSGYDDLAVYVNYAKGDEKLEQIYGARKLPRLVELKRRYDPDNVFRFHHALPMGLP